MDERGREGECVVVLVVTFGFIESRTHDLRRRAVIFNNPSVRRLGFKSEITLGKKTKKKQKACSFYRRPKSIFTITWFRSIPYNPGSFEDCVYKPNL